MSKVNLAIILLVSLVVAVLASFFASGHPDGLEWVAGHLGFIGQASGTPGVMPDYSCPFIKNGAAATITAAVFGTVLMFGLFLGFVKILKWR